MSAPFLLIHATRLPGPLSDAGMESRRAPWDLPGDGIRFPDRAVVHRAMDFCGGPVGFCGDRRKLTLCYIKRLAASPEGCCGPH